MFDMFRKKYKGHDEAVILSCFFNPQNSSYRLMAFGEFYKRIKHLNHRIIECVIGDAKPQLPKSNYIKTVYSSSLLFHKEALINNLIKDVPQYKYIFWVDGDTIFTNLNWLVEGVEKLKTHALIQPFEYCVHLGRDELKPSFEIPYTDLPNVYNKMVWKSFCSNYASNKWWTSQDYNAHGHVGFAWGATRAVLDKVPLYDKALVGGADHIMAHAAVGQVPHPCMIKAFTDPEEIAEINEWSNKFYHEVRGKVSSVQGDLYHIWHGDIDKRDYFNRIRKFSRQSRTIKRKDDNGLYIDDSINRTFMYDYFRDREVAPDKFEPGGGKFGGGGATDSWQEDPKPAPEAKQDNTGAAIAAGIAAAEIASAERFS